MNADESGLDRQPAVAYAAKSTEDKHGSIPTQLADCRAMAEREGWKVIAAFEDEGFSAFKGNRGPDLEAAKRAAAEAALRYGSAVLVVQHSDRLARGAGDAPGAADHLAEVYFAMRRLNVSLRSVQDDGNLTNPLLAAMIGERNSEDSRRKSLACRDGARRRVAERGRQQGMAPFGYGLNDDGDLVPRDDQAAVVRRIFAAYLGGAGTGRIAADLTREGVRPPRAETWDRSQISNMLRSPVYVGKVHSNGEVFDGQHEAIVSAADWERAQRLRAAKRASATGGRGKLPSGSHLLTLGLLRCGSCGGAMSPRTYRHRPGLEVYLCSTRRKTGGSEVCQQPSVGRELVDSAVLRHFAAVGLDEEQTLARLREHGDLRLTEARAAREQAEVEASKAAAGVERVRRYVREGRLEPEELREAKAEAEAAQARVALLLEREGEAERDAAARDVEAEALSAVTHVRSVIAGQIGAAGEVDAVRAALTEIFSAFVLRRVDQAPSYVAVWPELAAGEYFVEPIIRPEAALGSAWVMPDLADFGSPDEPVRLEDALRLGITGTVEYDGDELPLRRVPLALPGGDSTSALSRGANDLLRLGATPLTGSDDVLELFGLEQAQAEAVDLSEPADKVLARLRDAPASADELVRATGLDAGSLASALTELELAGVVVAAGGLFRAD